MKILIYLLSVFFLITGSVSVSAATKTPIYSASINKDGTLAAQSPHWIESIEYSSQPDYAASYKVNLMPDAFQKEPKFCVASTYDNSSYEHTLYGIAKLSSKPTRSEVNVIGLMLGANGPSGDSSMSFYLVCGK
ncbi:hypothetical protein GHO42_00295 [Pseudomonas sp. FSL R10-0056]|jgi:hypothetical protein|uniref:hypothetical protein n=1 Tax=Pseudomonas TaxID=286 RepID=UPI000BA1D479|nr:MULTISPECIES: hypothetical protein [Pseudomonas]MBO4966743.1 hypothetical protein [Pseudomonas sp.]MBP3858986.1 hypothetical protein [Pseudomonas sp.]MBP3933758.1 hypothetical protein [Pseudomonas sp.]MDN5406959.1 hypothetical protein [Pseudomonas sp.]MDN5448699.1 hypothetical protein [Pseudomonas sp.]